MPDNNHDDQRDRTTQDIDAAAREAGTTRERVREQKSEAVQPSRHASPPAEPQSRITEEQDRPIHHQDGYKETEGHSYAPSPDAKKAQEGYDPTHSGARKAQNRPGKRVDTPGRETGTSWGEDQQMGITTDTSDRRNPAQ
jgi:hypothetical protein